MGTSLLFTHNKFTFDLHFLLQQVSIFINMISTRERENRSFVAWSVPLCRRRPPRSGERFAGGMTPSGGPSPVGNGGMRPGPPLGADAAAGRPRLAARDGPFTGSRAAARRPEIPKGRSGSSEPGVGFPYRNPVPCRGGVLPRPPARHGMPPRSRDTEPTGSRGARGVPTGHRAQAPPAHLASRFRAERVAGSGLVPPKREAR